MGAPATVTVETSHPVDLGALTASLRHGGLADPTMRFDGTVLWRATTTDAGPVTTRLSAIDSRHVTLRAWGPGADAAVAGAAALVGAGDDDGGLSGDPHPFIRTLARSRPAMRMIATGDVWEALVPAILGQKVQGRRATASYRRLIRAQALPAPRPTDPSAPRLLLPPGRSWVAARAVWEWHRWDVEEQRASRLQRAAVAAPSFGTTPGEARDRLARIPGIGPWTVAEVSRTAFGDPDAVSVGDYWLKHWVCHNLAGEPRGTDERMLELLAAWPGQRGRVCRLILAGGAAPPRYGPRLAIPSIAAW